MDFACSPSVCKCCCELQLPPNGPKADTTSLLKTLNCPQVGVQIVPCALCGPVKNCHLVQGVTTTSPLDSCDRLQCPRTLSSGEAVVENGWGDGMDAVGAMRFIFVE